MLLTWFALHPSRHRQQHGKVRQQRRRPGSLHDLQLPAGRSHRKDRLQDRREVAQRAEHECRGRRVDSLRAKQTDPELAGNYELTAVQREPYVGPARYPIPQSPLSKSGGGTDPNFGLLHAVQGGRDHDNEHGETWTRSLKQQKKTRLPLKKLN